MNLAQQISPFDGSVNPFQHDLLEVMHQNAVQKR